MATKLDRLGRTARDILDTLDQFAKRGVRVIVIQFRGGQSIDMDSTVGRLVVIFFAGLAQFEAHMKGAGNGFEWYWRATRWFHRMKHAGKLAPPYCDTAQTIPEPPRFSVEKPRKHRTPSPSSTRKPPGLPSRGASGLPWSTQKLKPSGSAPDDISFGNTPNAASRCWKSHFRRLPIALNYDIRRFERSLKRKSPGCADQSAERQKRNRFRNASGRSAHTYRRGFWDGSHLADIPLS